MCCLCAAKAGANNKCDISGLSACTPSLGEDKDRELARLRAAIWAIIDVFEGAVDNYESRGKGGQHVPYHGDFANMPPSGVGQMRKWARSLREALKNKWPMLRDEYVQRYGMTDTEALDHMFRDREP